MSVREDGKQKEAREETDWESPTDEEQVGLCRIDRATKHGKKNKSDVAAKCAKKGPQTLAHIEHQTAPRS